MKRDMDLVRDLLIKIADGQKNFNLYSSDTEKNKDEIIEYHLDIMEQFELLTFNKSSFMDETVSYDDVKLTWIGQDYLNAIKNDTVWQKTKEAIKEKGLKLANLSFDLILIYAKSKVKEILDKE